MPFLAVVDVIHHISDRRVSLSNTILGHMPGFEDYMHAGKFRRMGEASFYP